MNLYEISYVSLRYIYSEKIEAITIDEAIKTFKEMLKGSYEEIIEIKKLNMPALVSQRERDRYAI